MRIKSLLFIALPLVLLSCLKENLDPENLDKVVMLQVDYKTYKFEGGKEFSYFYNDTSTVQLPLNALYKAAVPNTEGRLSILYAGDTIFDGTTAWQTDAGMRLFPQNIDPSVHYLPLENKISQPMDSRFQVVFNDLGTEPKYDSIWNAIAKLQMVNRYLVSNLKAKIGLFLYRPKQGTPDNPGNWKWYVVLKN